MRLSLALALAAGLLAFQKATPAAAAVAVHTYQITSGTSSGSLSIGNITGGQLTVQFPGTTGTCPTCNTATLLSGYILGTLAMATFTPMVLSQFNPGTGTDAPNQFGGFRAGMWIRASYPLATSVAFSAFGALGTSFAGNVGQFSGAALNQIGTITTQGHEVFLPEPSSSGLLATAGFMLGAYALRRARPTRFADRKRTASN